MHDLGWWLGIPGGLLTAGELTRRGRRRYKRLKARGGQFLDRLEAASSNAQDLRELAGSVTQLVFLVLRRLDQLEAHDTELENRIDDLAEVVVDVQADVGRLKKKSIDS